MKRKRNLWSWALVGLGLLLIASGAFYVLLPQLQAHTTVRIGDGVFLTRVAKTAETREKGLSGTTGLRDNQAMLFIFDSDGKWPIWMKDMKYSIDIVWLNKDKEVVYIVKNASPESYPYEQFTPKQDARYVLEFPAGTVSKKSITIDEKTHFDENAIEGWL